MASTDLAHFRKFVFESSFLDTYEIDPETVAKIKVDDVELMHFSFVYLAATLFGAQVLKIKEEKVQAKIKQIKERQDQSILDSIKEYEAMKVQRQKEDNKDQKN
jgi:hypothetical protein